jgi:hypothetical protein
MPIVGGLDIHRKQITFDYLDTATGEVKRGQIAPADRAHLRAWLARFAGHDDVAFAVEGCAGWRYVAGELAAPGSPRIWASRPTPPRCGAASGTPRPIRPTPGICGRCWPRGGCPDAGSAGASPGVPGAAGDLSRPAGRAHRPGAAARCSSIRAPHRWPREPCAPSRAWPRCGPRRPRTCPRLGSSRSLPPWTCSPPPKRSWIRCATSCAMPPGISPARRCWPSGCMGSARSPGWRSPAGWPARTGSPPPRPRRSGSPAWTSPCTPPDRKGPPVGCPGKGRRCCAGRSMRPARPTPAPRPPDHGYYAAVADRKNTKRGRKRLRHTQNPGGNDSQSLIEPLAAHRPIQVRRLRARLSSGWSAT